MGLIISVYRNAEFGDCTNGGITSRFTRLCVVNVEGPADPDAYTDAAPVMLVKGNLAGTLKIVEAVKAPSVFAGIGGKPKWQEKPGWAMMGGNYAATSDSRFTQACEKILGHRFYGAVPVHDRYED